MSQKRQGVKTKNGMEQVYKEYNQQSSVRQGLQDVYEEVNWAYLAKNYFGKSRSWLYHKFSGRNNGVQDDFNENDRNTLREALHDIANRINAAAERL